VFTADGTGALSTSSDLGGNLASGPAAISWGANHIAVFATWTDDSVRTRTWDGTSWSPWASLGGALHWEPGVVSMFPGHIAVFGKSANNGNVYIREFIGGGWSPAWLSFGGDIQARPMAVSWGSGHMAIFGKGGGDHPFYYKQWTGTSWSPSWINIGGSFPHFPVPVSRGPGLIDVLAIGNNGRIYIRHYNGTSWVPSGWVSLGTKTFSSSPAVALRANGSMQVFARSHLEVVNGVSTYVVYSNTSLDGGYTWGGWQQAMTIGSAPGGNPAAGTRNGSKSHAAITNGASTNRLLYHTWED
jgi:hypothetical protein